MNTQNYNEKNQKPTKIKIAYVLPTLDKGGAERMVVDLILNLNRAVFEPVLILFKRGGEWLAELAAENIPVIILEKKRKIDPLNFWRLFKALKNSKPQIIHTHLGGDLYGRLAAKLLGVPVILSTEHNINSDEKPLQNFLKRITNGLADKIVAVSEAVKKDIISRYKAPETKISVILNGVETTKFLSRAKEKDKEMAVSEKNKAIIFGTMGRLSPQKGHLTLIKAWKQLKTRADCLIAGSGPLAASLNEEIKKAELDDKIKLVGPVSDPAAFLNSLDAFVFPSFWEGLGIVLLEAGLVGLPIIASAVNGITEIINEDTGWLVPAGDADALAAKIDWLAVNLNKPEVKDKSDRLRAKIIADFDIKKIAGEYQNLYRELLERKSTKQI